jgi:hypothetical protein
MEESELSSSPASADLYLGLPFDPEDGAICYSETSDCLELRDVIAQKTIIMKFYVVKKWQVRNEWYILHRFAHNLLCRKIGD